MCLPQRLSKTIKNDQRRSKTIKDYQRLSKGRLEDAARNIPDAQIGVERLPSVATEAQGWRGHKSAPDS